MRWIRNYSEKYNKPTSKWHLFHSLRTTTEYSFALTYCGQRFTNPRSSFDVPDARFYYRLFCDDCYSVHTALKDTVEVPEELLRD